MKNNNGKYEYPKTKRCESFAKRYKKSGVFNPEIVNYGNQILYEVEQDLNAMKWAIQYLRMYFEYIEEKGKKLETFGDMDCKRAYDVLIKRVSEYSCPNNYKSGKLCPLNDACTFPKCRF